MKKKQELIFLLISILLALLYLLAGYSLVKVLYQEDWENNFSLYILEAIYLILHFVFIGIIFYLNFRAYKLGPQILLGLTLDKDNKIIKKTSILAGIFAILFFLLALYCFLITLGLDIPLSNFLGGLSYDVYNGALLLAVIAFEIFIYPFTIKEK